MNQQNLNYTAEIPRGLGLWTGNEVKPQASGMLFLSVEGAKQGKFQSSSKRKDHVGQILVLGVNHSLIAPRDASSGLIHGKRQHGVMYVSFMNDRTVPLFYNALTNNETLKVCKLEVYAPAHMGASGTKAGEAGGMPLQYTIELKNCNMCRLDCITVEPNGLAFIAGFTYMEITWTWADGGVTADDKWEQTAS